MLPYAYYFKFLCSITYSIYTSTNFSFVFFSLSHSLYLFLFRAFKLVILFIRRFHFRWNVKWSDTNCWENFHLRFYNLCTVLCYWKTGISNKKCIIIVVNRRTFSNKKTGNFQAFLCRFFSTKSHTQNTNKYNIIYKKI